MDYLTALNTLCLQIGPAASARRLGVTPRTVRRWRAQQTRPHAYLQRLIFLEYCYAFGALDAFGVDCWRGWRIAGDGLLYDPAGNAHSPDDLGAGLFLRLNGVRAS